MAGDGHIAAPLSACSIRNARTRCDPSVYGQLKLSQEEPGSLVLTGFTGPVIGLVQQTPSAGAPVTPSLLTPAVELLASLTTPEEVREKAWEVGAVRRTGKVCPYEFLMVVILGLSVRGTTSIAQLGHLFGEVTGVQLARSSFWARFNGGFSELTKWLLDRLVGEARQTPPTPPGYLKVFKDVLAVDSTVVKVHDDLRRVWKGTRRTSAKAALKVHAWVRALTGELVKYRVTREAFGDSRAFGIDSSLRGTLVLMDRGDCSPSLWRRIDTVGGYFLTRVPKGWNQVITSMNRRHRGRARKLVGKSLQDALRGIKRQVLDVNVVFRCRVRGYGGLLSRKVDHEFRVIGQRRPDGELALYVTNAPPQMLSAEAVWDVYRLRWEAETFFKTAKSGCALNELPSKNRRRVEALVYAALIRAHIAMTARCRFVRRAPQTTDRWLNPGQWIRC